MKMDKYTAFGLIAICTVNTAFLIVGTFFNTIVVVCICKTSQLRKKVSYFLILVLSSSDLVAILYNHPMIIYWYLSLYMGNMDFNSHYFKQFRFISGAMLGFSMLTLLTITLERYLGLTCPLFHRKSVTKRRTLLFLVVSTILSLIPHTLSFEFNFIEILVLVIVGGQKILIILMNIKVFLVAKSLKERTASDKKLTPSFKKYYICLLALGCLFICYCPAIVYSVLILAKTIEGTSKTTFFLWATTLVSINSTINSFIFFWNNIVLRKEGIMVLKSCLNLNGLGLKLKANNIVHIDNPGGQS